jgi:hypothetical protein
MLNEPATQALPASFGRNGKIGNARLSGLSVHLSGDITSDSSVDLGDKHSRRIRIDIVVDMPGLSPPPIVSAEEAKSIFHQVIQRHSGK